MKFQRPDDPLKQKDFDHYHEQTQVECRNCLSCRNRHAMDWGVRQYHEAITTHGIGQHLFITPTYDQENIPEFGFYDYGDMQAFHKRLRTNQAYRAKKLGIPLEKIKARFCVAPEYGGQTLRPHFHGNYFNMWIPDLVRFSDGKNGIPRLRSKMIEDAWGKGIIDIQPFGPGSAAYLTKHHSKQNGESMKLFLKQRHYAISEKWKAYNKELTGLEIPFNPETGEILPETMPLPRVYASTNPGIGKRFYERYKDEIYQTDSIIMKGVELPVPKYYDRLLKDDDPEKYEEIKAKREEERQEYTPEELQKIEDQKYRKFRFFHNPGKL